MAGNLIDALPGQPPAGKQPSNALPNVLSTAHRNYVSMAQAGRWQVQRRRPVRVQELLETHSVVRHECASALAVVCEVRRGGGTGPPCPRR